MATGATPHFHNTMGAPKIQIGAKEFMCIGAMPPFDHPHVFLMNKKLHGDESNPKEAAWHGR
jgi:uncharacterized Zn-finger protein